MKILFVTPFLPSNKGAGSLYTKMLLEELSKEHDVDLFYFHYRNDGEYIPINNRVRIVGHRCVNMLSKLISIICLPYLFPLFTARFNWRVCLKLRKLVKDNNYDYIYLDFSQTFSYSLFIKHHNIILMSHDVILQRYTRARSKFLWWIKWTESYLLKKGTAVFTFSQKDSIWLKDKYGINSRPTAFFLSNDVVTAIPQEIGNYYVFMAGWSRYDNYEALDWFIENVIDNIDSKISFKIIGGGMPVYLLKKIETYGNVHYLGFVDNPYPIIANAIAEIAPLHYGAGVKVKCVEALACGTPIIGTDVAFEGIDEKFLTYSVLANTPEDYVSAINNLNVSLAKKINNKKKFLSNYNNKSILSYIRN